MKLTYVHDHHSYTEDVHACWNYLLYNLNGVEITAVSQDGCAIEFITTNRDAEFLVKFISDCDFGVVLNEDQRKQYEQENGPLF